MAITYRVGNNLDLDGVIELYHACTPGAEDYYPRLGFSRHPQAWTLT